MRVCIVDRPPDNPAERDLQISAQSRRGAGDYAAFAIGSHKAIAFRRLSTA